MLNRFVFSFLLLLIFIVKAPAQGAMAEPTTPSASDSKTFLFVHGAWGGGWEYAKVDSLLSSQGHRVYHPTLTGLGERMHLMNDNINLDTHIQDVINVIQFEQLNNIILVGHSYGGMVVTGVADKLPERIAHLVYLDAFVPKDGESVRSINGEDVWNAMIVPKLEGQQVQYPFGPTAAEYPMDVPQPVQTLTQSLELKNPKRAKIPTAFILMEENGNAPFTDWGANRARAQEWPVYTMQGGHYAMRDQPEQLVAQLQQIVN
ncbi:alpha/beta fold hydrolase [Croceiramulus getboli]|nr:alpha/beta hydrolase [Flavobacteriaceae bacterium YJPT1-3]